MMLPPPLTDAAIPELPGYYRGKVRENYDLPDGRRILVATDRLSAFDIILASIPADGDGEALVRAYQGHLPELGGSLP